MDSSIRMLLILDRVTFITAITLVMTFAAVVIRDFRS